VEKMCFFQVAPTLYLSILICSNRCQYDFLKVLLKKNPHNLPVGYVKNCSSLTKCPILLQFQPYLQTPEHIHSGHHKCVKCFNT
jgi:hypothetical protein